MSHSRFGQYTEGSEPGVIEFERLASHPAIAGDFTVHPQHGPNGYRIINSAVPMFLLETVERADAEFIVDLLNLARGHCDLEDEVPTGVNVEPSHEALLAELRQLELDAHDKRLDGTAADRQVHHGAAGAAEQTRINAIREELRRRGVQP